MRTLARYKIQHNGMKRKVEIDGGLDLPLVTMLLCFTPGLQRRGTLLRSTAL